MITCQVKNVVSPHSQDPQPQELGWVLNQDEGAARKMSRKTVIFPQLQGHRDVKEKLVLIKNKPKNVNRMLR